MLNIIIGDVHGTYIELQELLDKLNYDPSNHKLIFCGDLVSRGPDSLSCVQLVKELVEKNNAVCISGNHENKYVRYRRHEKNKALTGKKNPMRISKHDISSIEKFSDEEIEWLANLPITYHIKDNWHAIHGGLEPRFSFKDQIPDKILRCRYVDYEGKMVALPKDKSQPLNTAYWTEVWGGLESIVYGHFVHSLSTPCIDIRSNGVKCIGIDTGCVFGGHLTAYILEEDRFVQVRAKKEYYHIDGLLD